jgi:hypothetical protein
VIIRVLPTSIPVTFLFCWYLVRKEKKIIEELPKWRLIDVRNADNALKWIRAQDFQGTNEQKIHILAILASMSQPNETGSHCRSISLEFTPFAISTGRF